MNKDNVIVGVGYNSMPYLEGIDNDDESRGGFPWKRGNGSKEQRHKDPETKYPYGILLT